MSAIQMRGKELVEHVLRQQYFSERRRNVDAAWAEYYLSAIEGMERGDPQPYRYGFEKLSWQTNAFVKREAERWARNCRKYRLYEDDFESDFRFAVAKAALRYDGAKGSFFDYLRGTIRNAGRDVVRNALTKKRRINHLAKSLGDEKIQKQYEKSFQAPSAEQLALLDTAISEMASEPSLDGQEQNLLQYLRKYPDATLQEMADEIGVRDRKQASRVKERLANKVRKYL